MWGPMPSHVLNLHPLAHAQLFESHDPPALPAEPTGSETVGTATSSGNVRSVVTTLVALYTSLAPPQVGSNDEIKLGTVQYSTV